MKHHLHGGPPESIDAEALRKEVDEIRQKNKELQEQVAQLETAVCLAPRTASLCYTASEHLIVEINCLEHTAKPYVQLFRNHA